MTGRWIDVSTEDPPEACLVWAWFPVYDQVRIARYLEGRPYYYWADAYGNRYAHEEVTHWRFITYPPTP